MKRALPRLVLCVLAAVLVVAIGVVVPWRLGHNRSLHSVSSRLVRELRRSEALSHRDELVQRCLAGKAEVTAEVVAGRLTLTEAADAFRRLHEGVLDAHDDLAGPYPMPVDEETLCRNVILWVERDAGADPQRRAAVVARLEEELRQLRRAPSAGHL